jgi:hypothetical protein
MTLSLQPVYQGPRGSCLMKKAIYRLKNLLSGSLEHICIERRQKRFPETKNLKN